MRSIIDAARVDGHYKKEGHGRFSAINSEIYKNRSTNYLTETENDWETIARSGNGNRKPEVSSIIIEYRVLYYFSIVSINQSINQSWIYIAYTRKASNALPVYTRVFAATLTCTVI